LFVIPQGSNHVVFLCLTRFGLDDVLSHHSPPESGLVPNSNPSLCIPSLLLSPFGSFINFLKFFFYQISFAYRKGNHHIVDRYDLLTNVKNYLTLSLLIQLGNRFYVLDHGRSDYKMVCWQLNSSLEKLFIL